jgi:hypothetical protein
MERQKMQLVERYIHEPREVTFDKKCAADELAHEAADGRGFTQRHEGAEVLVDVIPQGLTVDAAPQMTDPDVAPGSWYPRFFDYLYVSFTNSTAFSPTDTMPLLPRTKLLMGAQATAALITSVLVIARGVSLLSGG